MNDSGGEGAGQKLRDAAPPISLKSHKRLPGGSLSGAPGGEGRHPEGVGSLAFWNHSLCWLAGKTRDPFSE